MDLALLGTALAMPGTKQGRVAAAAAAVAGVTALDVMASKEHSKRSRNGTFEGALEQDLRVKKSVIIDRSPQTLYEFWRNFENLPQVMYHLESVRSDSTNGKRSHWVAKGPAGARVENSRTRFMSSSGLTRHPEVVIETNGTSAEGAAEKACASNSAPGCIRFR